MKDFIVSIMESLFLNCLCMGETVMSNKIKQLSNGKADAIPVKTSKPNRYIYDITNFGVQITFFVDDNNFIRKIEACENKEYKMAA